MQLALITGFGVLGIWLRYGIGLFAEKYSQSPFPYHTLVINILGSFIIGVVYVLGAERSLMTPELRIALMVGLLGGFTTFSAFSLETIRMIEQQMTFSAISYVLLSAVFGIAAACAGLGLTRLLFTRF